MRSRWLKRALLGAVLSGGALVIGGGIASADVLSDTVDDAAAIVQDQSASNDNSTEQNSDAQAETQQTNVNVPVSVLSSGSNNGDVHQSNDAHTNAAAGNANSTEQGVQQDQDATSGGKDSGSSCDKCYGDHEDGGDVDQGQEAHNSNDTEQNSSASAGTEQTNINVPVSILSSGSNNGDVHQSNDGNTKAESFNDNATTQSIGQDQLVTTDDAGSPCDKCGGSAGDIVQSQDGTNANSTTQDATSEATTHQVNVNAPVSILSSGSNNGDVHQGNDAHTNAAAGNANSTEQGVQQDQDATSGGKGSGSSCHSCYEDHGNGGDIVQSQSGSNENATEQDASATATTEQTNINAPLSILSSGSNGSSCGCGGSGDVDQSNDANTKAEAYNANATEQWIGQDQKATSGSGDGGHDGYDRSGYGDGCGCHESRGGGDVTQSQDGSNANETKQDAAATAETTQENKNLPFSFLSSGSNGGDVRQGNDAHTTAGAFNWNETKQGIWQDQAAWLGVIA
ncbi:MAG: hypothetical protein WD739_06815 [Actinomycetota bacterium]